MKRIKYLAFLCIILCIMLLACGESGLSKGKAETIIASHFEDWYYLFLPQSIKFTFEAPRNYMFVLAAKEMGLIRVKQATSVLGRFGTNHSIENPGMGDTFSVTFTEKGTSAKQLNATNGSICFLMGQRKIDKVVEIKKIKDTNQFTVLFSFVLEYNELGRELVLVAQKHKCKMPENNSRLRGKAIILYDSFLKKYILKSVLLSVWEKENWIPACWIDNNNGRPMVVVPKLEEAG